MGCPLSRREVSLQHIMFDFLTTTTFMLLLVVQYGVLMVNLVMETSHQQKLGFFLLQISFFLLQITWVIDQVLILPLAPTQASYMFFFMFFLQVTERNAEEQGETKNQVEEKVIRT